MEHAGTNNIEQIAEARARITHLLFEIDDIKLQINPRIAADYATKIGYLENELFKCQISAQRARRRFMLAQARVNAGLTFNEDEFEALLDEELAEWQRQLEQNIKDFLAATERLIGTKTLSPSESREVKRLHHELIKRLHPDLHPQQTEEANRFFMLAQTAFEEGNLELLRSIDLATEGMNEQPDEDYSEDEAAAELELVLAHERLIRQQLDELKSSNPYALKEKLEDGDWVIKRTTELKTQIEEQKAAKDAYDERFRALARSD